ncbi:MAG TPA: hypothetical protein VK279_14325, partial [Solirubrobacteraceae bacterium]|nr:hypothetical protein [Solirubrobacteraceae bacterium]
GEADAERIVERAAGVLGLGPAAPASEAFWGVRRLLEALARERPLVLVLDDLHWAQPTLLDLVEHVAEWGRAPILVVALGRPELRELRPVLAREGGLVADVLALEPLAPAASRALVDGLLGAADLPSELAERVLETTEGNPLFLSEMLRNLVDEGALRREGDRWIAARPDGDVAVPPTIDALLAARLDRLGAEERCVVERAAVVGHEFYPGAVAELSPEPVRAALDVHLGALGRKELIATDGAVWIDEPVFRFHHVLIRDAAYRALLKEARADLHERLAAWLERKTGGRAAEHEELIAFHLERAHRYRVQLGPLDERGRALGERAAARLHAAGRRALAREDLPAATDLLARALALTEGPRRTGVLIDLAEAQLSAGDTTAAQATVEELGAGADARGAAWGAAFAAQLATLTGGAVRARLAGAEAAAATLAAAGDRAGEAKAHQVTAAAHGVLGQVGASEAALDRALVAARAADDERRVTGVLSTAPRAALWGPSPVVQASGRCLDVVRILRMTQGTRHVEAAALRCQAVLEGMRGRPRAARGILASCRSIVDELGLTLERHELDAYAGLVELLAGEPVDAEALLRRAEAGFAALGVASGAAQAAALLAQAALEQGRVREAEALTHSAQAHGGEDLKTTIAWSGVRAQALARRGAHDDALRLAERAVALAEATDALADHADALMALAAVRAAAGAPEAAAQAAAQARRLYARKEHAVGVARAARALGDEAAPGPGWGPQTAPASGRAALGAAARRSVSAAAREHEAHWTRICRDADWDALDAVLAGDVLFRDRRRADDTGVQGIAAVRAVFEGIPGASPGAASETEVLAGLDDGETMISAGINRVSGTGERGGAWETVAGWVRRARYGRSDLLELLDGGDEAALVERFDELCGQTWDGLTLHPLARDAIAPEVVAEKARWLALVRARDWDGLAAHYGEPALRDERTLAWVPQQGAEDVLAPVRATAEAGGRFAKALLAGEVIDGRAVSATIEISRVPDPEAETRFGHVGVREGARYRGELLPDDPALVLARYDERRVGRAAPAPVPDAVARADDREGLMDRFAQVRVDAAEPGPPAAGGGMQAFVDAINARDWEAVARSCAPDFVQIDHRAGGWGRSEGPGASAEHVRTAVSMAPGLRLEVGLLAASATV